MSLLRLRLSFAETPADHPQHCYFLVDTSHCRVIADLAFLIAERFDLLLTKTHGLRLSIDGYALLPGEDIRVVRDNDVVRVSEGVTPSRGAIFKPRKRRSLVCDGSERAHSNDDTTGSRKKAKRPTKGNQTHCKEPTTQSRQKTSRKSSLPQKSEIALGAKRGNKVKPPSSMAEIEARADGDVSLTSTDSTSSNSDSSSKVKGKPMKSSSSSSTGDSSSSSKSNDSSSSDEKQTTAVSNPKRSAVGSSQPIPEAVKVSSPASTVPSSRKMPIRTLGTSSSSTAGISSSSTASRNHVHFDSDGEVVDESCTSPLLLVLSSTKQKSKSGGGQQSTPIAQPVGRGRGQFCQPSSGPMSGPPQVGRSRVVGGPHDILTVERQVFSRQAHTTASTSVPAVVRRPSMSPPGSMSTAYPPESSSSNSLKLVPKSMDCGSMPGTQQSGGTGQDVELRDYSQCPKLQGYPRAGDVIAYKVLELSANYLPQISAFKEGRVLAVDTDQGSVTVKLRPECLPPPRGEDDEPGKFELVYSDDENDSSQTTDEVTVLLSNMQDTKLVQS